MMPKVLRLQTGGNEYRFLPQGILNLVVETHCSHNTEQLSSPAEVEIALAWCFGWQTIIRLKKLDGSFVILADAGPALHFKFGPLSSGKMDPSVRICT